MTKQRFLEAVSSLFVAKGRQMELLTADVWHEVHGTVPIGIFEAACRAYNAESEDKFAPVPGALHAYIDRAEAQAVLDRMRAEREPCFDGPRGCKWQCQSGIIECWHPKSVAEAIQVVRAEAPRTTVGRFGREVATIRQYTVAVPCQCEKGDRYAVQRKGLQLVDNTELPGRYDESRFVRRSMLNSVALAELWQYAEQRKDEPMNDSTDFVAMHGGYRDDTSGA